MTHEPTIADLPIPEANATKLAFKQTVLGKTAIQGTNLVVSDLAASFSALGVVAYMDKLLPNEVKLVNRFVKKNVVLPYLDKWEAVLSLTKNAQTEQTLKNRALQSRDERSENIARGVTNLTAGALTGWVSTYVLQQSLNRATRTPISFDHGAKVLFTDAAIHLGAVGLVCMPFMAKPVQKTQHALKCAFRAYGFSDQKADDMAQLTVFNEIPNVVGMLAGIYQLYRHNKSTVNSVISHL